ncbi:unnamed protein product, partial [Prorocentrum cordatum]
GQHAQGAKWSKLVALLTEFTSDEPTHYDANTHSVSALNRLWVSLPGWIICQIHAVPRVQGLPEALAEKGVSDHAAQSCSNSQGATKPVEYQQIPRHIFESEAFQDLLNSVTRQLGFESRSPPGQIELFKWAVKEVARGIR